MLDLSDFYFTGDDYRYRFDPEAKQRFLALFRERFNSGVTYKGRVLKWDTVIEQRTLELSRYLVGRTGRVDFLEPSPALKRTHGVELRRLVLDLSQSDARSLGIGGSNVYSPQKNAKGRASFRIYTKTRERLNSGV
jgi:hypothetical protein